MEYPGDKVWLSQPHRWSGETCCLKRRAKPGEKTVTGYKDFAVTVPADHEGKVTIYLRGENPADDFKQHKTYASIDELIADGWEVD